MPTLLPESFDPLRMKIQRQSTSPMMDSKMREDRNKLSWAWEEALAWRFVFSTVGRYIKHSTVSYVEAATGEPFEIALSWSHHDITGRDREFYHKWRLLMAFCYVEKVKAANLCVCYLGRFGGGPRYIVYRAEFTDVELDANYDSLKEKFVESMHITEFRWGRNISVVSKDIPDLLPMEGRSRGYHVSCGVESMAIDYGLISKDKSGLTTTWAQCGCAFEDCLVKYLHGKGVDEYVALGELELDGIFGTPDIYHTPSNTMIEIKFPWFSSKRDPRVVDKDGKDKFARFKWQLMSYCKMKGTNFGGLSICHPMGDWRNFIPVYRAWGFEFTQDELDDNWELIKMKRDQQETI